MGEVIDLTQDDDINETPHLQLNPSPPPFTPPTLLPNRITSSITSLPSKDHRILTKKRAWLQANSIDTSPAGNSPIPPNFIPSALVFAQEEAGTAVCVSPSGLILTCAHCIAESPSELAWSNPHWLLFSSGQLVSAVPLAWDPKRDLSLLLITKTTASSTSSFPYTRISPSAPSRGTPLFCIGHPGSEDLECATPNTPTGYETLVLSTGTFRGLAAGQDPQDNAEIGALKHTCWAYWGHSGAPLVDRRRGMLVGLHSSWDESTGMRRGVPWEAVVGFLEEVKGRFEDGVQKDGCGLKGVV